MGGILVASQLVSKAKKYRTWSFVLGCFFFGGRKMKISNLDFNFQGLFNKLFDKDPIINQSIDWCGIVLFTAHLVP